MQGPRYAPLRAVAAALVGAAVLLAGTTAGAMTARNSQATVSIDVAEFPEGVRPPGYRVTVLASDDTGAPGDVVIPSTFYEAADGPAVLHLQPGCYVVELEALPIGARPDTVVWYATNQTTRDIPVCVKPGEQRTFEAQRLSIDGTPDRARGTVRTADGRGVAGVLVDIFAPVDTISDTELRALTIADHQAVDYRAEWFQDVVTNNDGNYLYFMPDFRPFCNVMTLVAPDGYRFETGKYLQRTTCPKESIDVIIEQVQPPKPEAGIVGTIRSSKGDAPTTTIVDLFAVAGDGTRAAFLGDTVVGPDGSYRLDVTPGCYIIVQIAPDGWRFTSSGTEYNQVPVCVGRAESATIDGVLHPVG